MKQSANALTLTGLAGAVAVAGASQAYGTIINVKPPNNITGNTAAALNGREYWNASTGTTTTTRPATFDLQFGYENGTLSNGNTVFATFVAAGNGGGTANYYYAGNGQFFAYGITKGQTIGTGAYFSNFAQSSKYFTNMAQVYKGTTVTTPPLMPPNTVVYLGFQFTLASDGLLHDGWLELDSVTYTNAANPGGIQFIAAAYNSVPDAQGGTIAAGQAGTNAVPEPGTLAALAMGAAALTGVGLKRRRAARAAAQA